MKQKSTVASVQSCRTLIPSGKEVTAGISDGGGVVVRALREMGPGFVSCGVDTSLCFPRNNRLIM